MENIYQEKGFKSRSGYLYSLADDYDIDVCTVFGFASVLGRDEDFDMLVTYIEDHVSDNFDKEEDELEETY